MERIKALRQVVRLAAIIPGGIIGRELMNHISPAHGLALLGQIAATLAAGYLIGYIVLGIAAVIVEYWND